MNRAGMQALFDPLFPKGLQWYWKGDFVKSLRDEAIDTHIAQAAIAPSELSLMHWGRAYWKAVHPFNLAGAYVNFMMDDESPDRLQSTYGDNFGRLAAVKTKYDAANLFRVNQNIEPQPTGAG